MISLNTVFLVLFLFYFFPIIEKFSFYSWKPCFGRREQIEQTWNQEYAVSHINISTTQYYTKLSQKNTKISLISLNIVTQKLHTFYPLALCLAYLYNDSSGLKSNCPFFFSTKDRGAGVGWQQVAILLLKQVKTGSMASPVGT